MAVHGEHGVYPHVQRWCVEGVDKRWRWVLGRQWQPSCTWLLVVGLNPSTADAHRDDATTRRCMDFARRWGHGGLMMVNLYAFRATDPRSLARAGFPCGRWNDWWLQRARRRAAQTLVAWGNHGLGARADDVLRMMAPCSTLGVTKLGAPRHPLYVSSQMKPVPWSVDAPEESR